MLATKPALVAAIACLAGVVSGSIGAAQADTGTTGSSGATGATGTTAAAPATITVNGAGFATMDSSSPSSAFHTAYLGALGNAIADAHTKAAAIAAQVGDTLGAVQSVTEQSNDMNGCSGPLFNAAGAAKGAPSVAGPTTKHRRRHHPSKPKATARIADATVSTCTVEADVTVTYAAAPA